jgi:hypothetical protein
MKVCLRFIYGLFFFMLLSGASYAACEAERAALASCLAAPAQCSTDRECGTGQACVLGKCQDIVTPPPSPPSCPPVTCIPSCTSRWASDGACRSYTPYCAREPYCTQNCTEYWFDGTCRAWSEDICSSTAPARCN